MWVAFLTRPDLLNREHLPPALNKPALKKTLGVLDVMHLGTEEREAYEKHLTWLRIAAKTLKQYEAKGFQEGCQGGKAERNIEIALKMLQQGMAVATICEITGLTDTAKAAPRIKF